MNGRLRVTRQPDVQSPALVVAWSGEVCELGSGVIGHLNRVLGGQSFCEIDPADFFPFNGVVIEDNQILFPESKFYICPGSNLVLLLSSPPVFEWYDFLSLVLDVAERECHAREVYAVGAMVYMGAHTVPRYLLGVFSSQEHKNTFRRYGIAGDWDYETPPGQKPTLNSYLLWMARRRGIPVTNLWVPIPFYLVAADDPKARRMVLEFLDKRLQLGIDFGGLDEEIVAQNRRLGRLRSHYAEIDDSIRKLENNISLSDEESQRLVFEIEKLLRSENNG